MGKKFFLCRLAESFDAFRLSVFVLFVIQDENTTVYTRLISFDLPKLQLVLMIHFNVLAH